MSNILRLVPTSVDAPKVRSCGACRHLIENKAGPGFWRCDVDGNYTEFARADDGMCGADAENWELALPAMPPSRQRGIFERAWAGLFGAKRRRMNDHGKN